MPELILIITVNGHPFLYFFNIKRDRQSQLTKTIYKVSKNIITEIEWVFNEIELLFQQRLIYRGNFLNLEIEEKKKKENE